MPQPQPMNREQYMKRAAMRQVELPDGSIVCIRALPASLIVSGADDAQIFASANLLVHSLCDAHGKLLFTPEEKDLTMSIDHMGLKAVLDAIIDLNGLKPPAEDSGNTDVPEKN